LVSIAWVCVCGRSVCVFSYRLFILVQRELSKQTNHKQGGAVRLVLVHAPSLPLHFVFACHDV
jgi:hypothetical protein